MVEHRRELRERVEQRQKLLEEALSEAEKTGHPVDRIWALNTELSVVADALREGWDVMSLTAVARLSAWLTATHNLVREQKVNDEPVPGAA